MAQQKKAVRGIMGADIIARGAIEPVSGQIVSMAPVRLERKAIQMEQINTAIMQRQVAEARAAAAAAIARAVEEKMPLVQQRGILMIDVVLPEKAAATLTRPEILVNKAMVFPIGSGTRWGGSTTLPAGKHIVTVSARGLEGTQKIVDVSPERVTRIEISL